MNIEKSLEKRNGGEHRERLLALEREGRYLFHGSPDIIDTLEPRQAYNNNEASDQIEEDGKPAVFATPYADVAIFRALINRGAPSSRSSFNMGDGDHKFSATQNLIDYAKDRIGRVYILDKQQFKKSEGSEGMEFRSDERVNPIEIIEVNFNDLPKNIQIIEPER